LLQGVAGTRGRFYFGIFALAFATLSYQILITRFFSVMFYYHLAFAAISICMFGLTRGAMKVYADLQRYSPERAGVEFARHASWFALTAVGTMITYLCAPLLLPAQSATLIMGAAMFAFVIPFTQSGLCVTLLLTRVPYTGGRMYAADLAGAALGCLGIVVALFYIDPVSATCWIAGFAAFSGWSAVRHSDERKVRRFSAAVTIIVLSAAALHTGLYASGKGHLGVVWAKGEKQTGTLFERWNTFSRVRVIDLGDSPPFGWGWSRQPDNTIEQHYLDIDADAATVITRMDRDIGQFAYLRDDVINAAYLVRQPHDVAVVGVGGGRDILSALHFGAARATGIEINPAIFEALTDRFADYSGHLYRQPGVSLVNAEARSYINQSPGRYDLIQISLIDTWAATAAGGLTLTENRLYTVEAWEDFYRALKPEGLLSVSRWYTPDQHRGEFYRLISIAAAALERHGVAKTELRRHVIAVGASKIVTVITRPAPFTDAEWEQARAALQGQGFAILLGPDKPFDTVTSTLLAGEASAAYFDQLPENITPSTDDKPFFFYTSRLSNLIGQSPLAFIRNQAAAGMILALLVLSFLACIYYVAVPFARLARRMPLATLTPPVAYFSAIGMGFMLIEISQMQRLMVFLGHPVYGLGVILFTLLLFSGFGSMTVGEAEPPRRVLLARVAAVLVALLVTGLLTPLVTVWARPEPITIRIAASVLLLAPPSFFMGMMFPTGLSLWRRHADLLPFFWSTNGITSVFASVLGMALSMQIGIAATFVIGACCYAVCALIVIRPREAV
jgi:SAM-dependent methyltransferase